MEKCFRIDRENPKNSANCLSRLCFLWMRKICYEGNTKGLQLKSLYKCRQEDKSSIITDKFEKIWNQELNRSKLKRKKPSLLKAIAKAYYLEYFYWGLLIFINAVILKTIQPVILSGLIKLFTNGNYTGIEILQSAGGLCALSIVSTFLMHHTNSGVSLIGMRLRIALSALVYRKILKLSQLSLSQTAAGQVVNLLSNDVARFDLIAMVLNYLWISPIQVVVICCIMWWQIGPSSMAGIISILVLTVPLQLVMGSVTSTYRMEIAKRTDNRVNIMSELLSGIQVIKMYTWETPFEGVVAEARKKEVEYLTKTSYIRAILISFMVFVERTTLAATVVCYVIMGNAIRADLVFSLAMFFNLLQLSLAIMFPIIISAGAEALVSVQRIQSFLLLEEKEPVRMLQSNSQNSINLENINASWIEPVMTLKHLNLKLTPGTLCAIIGPVGSGKSSLLKLLLGELSYSSGSIAISGKISYASQEPWLFASTVRNNILFGEEYDRSHYKTITKVCCLEKDFEQFPEKDKTNVGDRGVSLSGGQRARINLARAVYKEADIYLLDDPLSAVDTKVGKHLFDQCIVEYLRKKSRILVTHQLQYLKRADVIIVLNKGSIEAMGTFEELSCSELDFTKLLVAADETEEIEMKPKMSHTQRPSVSSIATTVSLSAEFSQDWEDNDKMEKKSGYKGSPFLAYVKKGGSYLWLSFIIFLIVFCQVLLSTADFWITLWTSEEEARFSQPQVSFNRTLSTAGQSNEVYETTSVPCYSTEKSSQILTHIREIFTNFDTSDCQLQQSQTTQVLMYIYVSLIITVIVITIFRSALYYLTCMKASVNLHNKMFHCLLQAPMRFFDTNPAGRVLNRFSKDMGAIDDLLPKALIDVIQIVLVMCGILVMVTISNPYLLVVMVILGVLFMKLRKWYITTAREIKLIEGVAKSPVFSYVSSSMDGLTTIRSMKKEETLMKQFDEHQDVHSSAWYLTVLCSVAFGFWLDLVCVIFVCVVVAGFVILDQYTTVGGSFIGLGISQSTILIGMLQYGMRQLAEVVNYLTSVERVLEYTQLEKEHPLTTAEDMKPKEPWPADGKIVFKDLVLRYVITDPPVINHLHLEIFSTEKIGIVGRTGAGKSSLIAALFRLAPIEGKILIDNVDTKSLGLKDLRRRISIIPQEPVLFSATMRYNLDPFNEFQDKDLWNVLHEVELKKEIHSLDFMVTEGGSNFSVGQRQLICLARAILRNNKILILDEATANVDPKTDELIQETIRRKFKRCTVLTIAHRLNTIMDSDKVLVMDGGCKVEFDHPHILLQNPDGFFTKMLNETGPAMTQTLRSVAFEAYQSKFNTTRL